MVSIELSRDFEAEMTIAIPSVVLDAGRAFGHFHSQNESSCGAPARPEARKLGRSRCSVRTGVRAALERTFVKEGNDCCGRARPHRASPGGLTSAEDRAKVIV